MKERSATVVVRVEDFHDHAAEIWEEAYDEASYDMQEPLRVSSQLSFCRNVDDEGRAIGVACTLEQAKYAACTVTAKDLSETADQYDWEPLCNQRRPKVVRRVMHS
jgi:hypothetical protein